MALRRCAWGKRFSSLVVSTMVGGTSRVSLGKGRDRVMIGLGVA